MVLEKPAIQGKRFMAGEVLYQIADLSQVWLLADVFEQDLGQVRIGQSANITVDAYPGKVFAGKVTFIYPTVTADTRTAKVRIELANPQALLKPAMYAQVEFATSRGKGQVLAVPDSAVLDTGTRQLVLVERGEGRFEPRPVKLGAHGDGYIEVLDGVKAGEQVVVSANFLIDAESNLNAAFSAFGQSGGERETGAEGRDQARCARRRSCARDASRRGHGQGGGSGPRQRDARARADRQPEMAGDDHGFQSQGRGAAAHAQTGSESRVRPGRRARRRVHHRRASKRPRRSRPANRSPPPNPSPPPTRTRGTDMLGRIIEWSVRNVFLVLLATLFVVAAGVYAVLHTPLDAIPDLSDVQVIIYTEYPGQAPQVVEDQVTYPLSTAMLAVPKAKVVRGLSVFGASFIYVIFEDGTDIYWARSRVLEYLNFASGRMPRGVTPTLGPDATGVGWVYEYAVIGAKKTLAELRTIQDWFVRYQLTKAQGVAEVASVGGFVQTYQVTVDPRKLQAYGIPLMKVVDVIRASNRDVGGRAIEMAETEYRGARPRLSARRVRHREPGGEGGQGHAGADPRHRRGSSWCRTSAAA